MGAFVLTESIILCQKLILLSIIIILFIIISVVILYLITLIFRRILILVTKSNIDHGNSHTFTLCLTAESKLTAKAIDFITSEVALGSER